MALETEHKARSLGLHCSRHTADHNRLVIPLLIMLRWAAPATAKMWASSLSIAMLDLLPRSPTAANSALQTSRITKYIFLQTSRSGPEAKRGRSSLPETTLTRAQALFVFVVVHAMGAMPAAMQFSRRQTSVVTLLATSTEKAKFTHKI